MTDFDPQSFEGELKRLKPATPPAHLLTRLREAPAKSSTKRSFEDGKNVARQLWPTWFWGAASATAALLLAAALLARHGSHVVILPPNSNPSLAVISKPVLKADRVEIGRRLLSSYDAVANLPGGEPVRFHCREWMDELVLRDSARGVVVERQTPRFEVIPVRFETY